MSHENVLFSLHGKLLPWAAGNWRLLSHRQPGEFHPRAVFTSIPDDLTSIQEFYPSLVPVKAQSTNNPSGSISHDRSKCLSRRWWTGVFWVLLVQAIEASYLRAQARQESFFRPMSITALVLFLTISGDIAYCVKAFGLTPAETVYLTLSDPKAVLGSALYLTSTLIGDGFMQREVWLSILFPQSQQPIFATAGVWITSCFALTLVYSYHAVILKDPDKIISVCLYAPAYFDLNLKMLNEIVRILEEYGNPYRKCSTLQMAITHSCCVVISLMTYVMESNVQSALVAMTNPVFYTPFVIPKIGTFQWLTCASPMAIKITTQSQNDAEGYRKSADFGIPPSSPHYLLPSTRSTNSARTRTGTSYIEIVYLI
ncbi:hypothetical protein B0H34DRAFT_677467 [Crassisporium funariophilum]|nr:hypothetical protein B0H34DRAFT_677467 [Crassisporium funariophilum]